MSTLPGSIPRAALPVLEEALRTFRVVALTGARQAGKTTLARDLVRDRGGVYFTLDDPVTLASLEADPLGALDRKELVVIDEFQRGGDPLVRIVKRLVDEDRRKGRFLLTGSTRFLTVPTLSESLAGRVGLVDLWPLSESEIRRTTGRFVDRLFGKPEGLRSISGEALGRDSYLELLCAGRFPELVGADAAARRRWCASYVRTVTHRDVPQISNIRHIDALEHLAHLIGARTAQEVNVAALAAASRETEVTLAAHLALLETVHFWFRLPAWSRNLTKKVVKHPKAHVVDSGLAAHLQRVGPGALRTPGSPSLGPLLETFVAGEICKQATWARDLVDVSHFRDRDGLEVDLVLESRDGRVALVEVKASSTVDAKDFRGIDRLQEKIGRGFANGVVLYLGEHTHSFGPGKTLLPVSALWAE